MKNYTKRATMCFVLFLSIISCTKEELPMSNEETNTSNLTKKIVKQHGFADNSMVIYWNEKTELVLSASIQQPTRTRLFAIIEIAVHDALNNIKPKYERYALNEKEKFA